MYDNTLYFKNKNLDDICVVSPDHGGATRARKMAVALDCPVAIIDKRRPKPNVAEIMGVLGDVEGKNCIMIDDMIDTAGTITLDENHDAVRSVVFKVVEADGSTVFKDMIEP